MIVRRGLTPPTAVFVALTLLGGFNGGAAERWSRQVSNSEWIPLANPRAATVQLPQDNARAGLLTSATHLPNPIQSLALPPALQHQYQEQLIQLQKTQENIQKLLLLQQQLRAQQQLLQSQAYVPYTNAEDEKQAPPPNAVQAPETLIPPHPSSDALPPVYPPQNFLSQRPGLVHQEPNGNQELPNLPGQGQVVFQQNGESAEVAQEGPPHAYVPKQGSQQRPDGKRPKGQQGSPQPSLIESASDEEEEVQLVYVPAETLAQRGHLKRNRGRKPYPVRQQHPQRENEGSIDQTPLSPEQAAFARQVLQEIQKEHEEKAHFLKEERAQEFAKLNEEQKALERKTRLQQEALQREQELLRQKEIEKKRKELERQEEIAKQRELDRIRDAREKQRQEELERRRLAEIRLKEEKRREEEARLREDGQKQLELENQQRDQLRTTNPGLLQQGPQSQALVREQPHRQQLADNTRTKKLRNRPRQRVNQEQSSYREATTTTPSPNQPPLSVYMGSSSSRLESVKVTDVLRILRDAKTIAVLDSVGPNSPQVFVGPSNLDPPYGYAKFDLPYLSSIDHNRVERKVDKLPFFVAPLSFDPPPGYSKIPFPAPHIGSVVVNTLSEASSPDAPVDGEQSPNPMPLIEPNSYSDVDQSGSISTTASYDTSNAPPNFPADSNSPKYESSHSTPPAGSRFRFRQYYDGKPASVVSTSYYDREQSAAKARQESKSTTPQSPKFDTTVSYRQEISYSSTPNFQDREVSAHDPSTKEQDLAAQLALINQELDQQRERERYNAAEQYHGQSNLESYDANDVRAPVGSAQYNLPAELPPISPHLPGLINSLLDKQEGNLPVASTPPPATTSTPATTTARASSTTYRPRTRSRVVPTRARTTQAPVNKTDRARRPTYNRSKSRFSTTTEEYNESSYEPTKARAAETTQKPNTIEHRRPTSRTQKLKTRDRTISQSAVQSHNAQPHSPADFENYPTQSDSQGNASPDAYSANGPASNLQPKETPSSGVSDYTRENYSPTASTQTENYPPLREFTIQHGIPSISDDYSKSQNYPPNHQPQEANQRQGATYDQNGGFEQAALEMTPVNGFNYQVASVSPPDQTSPQRPQEYPRYQTKLENANYNLASTEDPRIRPGEEHRYSPIYEVNVAQTQPDYNVGGQNSFRTVDDGKIETDLNASPIFVPLQQSKHEEYELQIPSTEGPLVEITTTKSTTTPASVIIRQRVRGRLSGGGRPHQDSAIQTRPRGSQDEYVRFSVVSHDSTRAGQRPRDGMRTRPRVRPQSHGSQVQTDGNEYIKIHAATQQQRLIATTTPPTTTSTTTTDRTSDEDVDYGFIRPPSFQPVNSPHPADSRFQTPVTYRPALSEIQHIIPNDETAVESSPAHILKNRPKYQQTPTRRPTTKIFAPMTTSTTTEAIPVATTMSDNGVYTVRSKTRPDETKTTRVRGRIRRPAKKRTTSTTESGLEANNELPLDENYPRITPQQLPVTAAGQQPLYDDNFDVAPQFAALNRNRPAQFYEESGENYPPEFLLNFGNLPEHSRREEYDQTQLASIQSKKYSNSGHVSSDASSVGDIYGAESQWSTKLSKTSFQPSFVSNRVADETKRSRNRLRNDQTNENAPEIITAGPEVPSVTMIVSADYQKRLNNADVDEMMDVFGKKTNAPDHTEKPNATTTVTSSPTSSETRNWMSREENFAEQMDDIPKVRIMANPAGGKTRRKRIRVRVRPLSGDFVTAESQHHNSAANSLHQNEYKYKVTTAQPITTTIAATTVTETTKKSVLQDFLEEMLKRDEASVPTRVNFVTTEWPTTTPYVVATDRYETTILEENHTPISTTLTPNVDAERAESSTESRNESQEAISEEAVASIQEETEAQEQTRSEEFWDKDSQEDQSEQNNLEDIEMFNEKYSLPSSNPDGSGTSKDTVAEMTGFPAATEEIRKLSAIEKENKEHIMTLRRQRVRAGESEAHPKNHRAKWSEVRYPPSTLSASSSTTSIPGVVTRNEGNGSAKTLSDYVKAIFDSMKSAEREADGVEIAKVIEAKNEAPANNSRFDDNVASVSAGESEETNRRAGTTDTSVTQRVQEDESATNLEETTTTKESATTFETTTLIPDTTANTAYEVMTEPSTTTSIVKTTTSMKQTAGDAMQMNSTTVLGKVLRTSTTTKVSHMTEICYRGRCVMTKPKMQDDLTR